MESPKRQVEEIAKCRDDFLYYINSYVWTYDPEAEEPVIPMVTWPAQERALRTILDCAEERRDCVIEKSRRQGGSWISILAMEAIWHFHPMRQFLLMSRSALMVDGKTADSLFWKLDFMHKRLPEWLMPKGWNPAKHRLKNYLENPENGSMVTGQATSDKTGVGGRAYVMFVDEFSRVEEDQAILDSTADTCRCRIFNSTHTGTGTAFYRLCERSDVKKIPLHWSENPYCNGGLYRYVPSSNSIEVFDKLYVYPPDFKFVMEDSPLGGPYPGLRSPWYDAEEKRRGNRRAVAMDLDIDPRGSSTQFFDPAMIRRFTEDYACEPSWQGYIDYDKDTGAPHGLVKSPGGPLKLWVRLKPDGTVPLAVYAMGGDLGAGHGVTPSVLCGADAATGEKVFEYANANIGPKELAPLACALGKTFKDAGGMAARFAWEHNGPGVPFGQRLMELYPSDCIYLRRQELWQDRRLTPSDKPGWLPTTEATRALLEEYAAALANKHYLNRSEPALKECLDFRYTPTGSVEHMAIKSKDNPAGANVNHGDRVIADALCWMMCRPSWRGRKEVQKRQLAPLSLAWRRKLVEDRERKEEVA